MPPAPRSRPRSLRPHLRLARYSKTSSATPPPARSAAPSSINPVLERGEPRKEGRKEGAHVPPSLPFHLSLSLSQPPSNLRLWVVVSESVEPAAAPLAVISLSLSLHENNLSLIRESADGLMPDLGGQTQTPRPTALPNHSVSKFNLGFHSLGFLP